MFCLREGRYDFITGSSNLFNYVNIFSIAIIKSKSSFLLALSISMTIIMSIVTLTCNSAIAQTIDYITKQQKAFENDPQIKLGSKPQGIGIDENTNRIYVTNPNDGTVSVIDGNSGSGVNNIRTIYELEKHLLV
jgi:hypothetical protein